MNHPHSRLRAGEPEAFRELFREHSSLVYRHAVRVTGNWALAEDVVSLTFLEAWRLRGKLRDEGDSPRPWLMGIAVNVLRNTTRAARRHNLAMARMPVADPVPDFADELVGRMADSEQLAAARKALGRLRRSEREVFALCVWSGLGYAEAAATLGIPVGTVRSRLSRARTRLRKLADDELRAARKLAAKNGTKNGAEYATENTSQKNTEPLPIPGQVQGGRSIAARPHKETHR
ncbi:RNA polymerase sigma factor [Kitasatospora purpeofusca]|uniref:RNA polymerase sigma factor n=1 Tax=Kitasatospora purpeofusca TaxID=67352 RepID=UPI00056C778E|nr:RNA polymerase sigma factor [Kitasatospora purpeofusca]